MNSIFIIDTRYIVHVPFIQVADDRQRHRVDLDGNFTSSCVTYNCFICTLAKARSVAALTA